MLVDLENITTVRKGGDAECVRQLKGQIPSIIDLACSGIGSVAAEAEAAKEAAKAEAAETRRFLQFHAGETMASLGAENDELERVVAAEALKLDILEQNYSQNKSDAEYARQADIAEAGNDERLLGLAHAHYLAKMRPFENALVAQNEKIRKALEVQENQKKIQNAIITARMSQVSPQEAVAAAVAAAAAEAAAAARTGIQYTLEFAANFNQAARALHALPLEFHTEQSEYLEWLCLCNVALIDFMVEAQAVTESTLDINREYLYVVATVVEKCEGSVPGAGKVWKPHTDEGVATDATITLSNAPDAALENMDSQRSVYADPAQSPQHNPLLSPSPPGSPGSPGGGRRPTPKKSTRRKPRRHTRNYQSRNKRKHRSNKKSTIKHRKSYRKHNRTVKRRKSRRHH
jgi:hypothetical protein